jgi:diguanylate cyclase (GGDEF)-like protein
MDAGRRTATLLLAVLYAVCGVMCFASAAQPLHRNSPVTLLVALGCAGLAGALLFCFRASRISESALHAGVALVPVLLGLLAWRSATAVGIVGLGPAMVGVQLYVAYFFARRPARLHAAGLVVVTTVGAVAAAPEGFAVPWLTLLLSVVALGEVQGYLVGRLRAAADTDPLTSVANRRAWMEEAARFLAHATRTDEPLSIAILDLDDFKEVNDRYGHGAGDALLRDLARGWAGRLRRADLLGRYGGDEFVLCLPDTDAAGAREVLAQLDATHEFRWSVGLATAHAGDTVDSMLARADADLYEQKRSGRKT